MPVNTIMRPSTRFATLVGDSDAIAAVRELVDRVAGSDASVLITGPSGSGKEVVANLLHQRGGRAARPFVAMNCAAVTPNLFDSELFGHEAGAFPGATQVHRGRFETANGGTLFLDEIGDMSADFQAKLLRILEWRQVERIGGTATIPVDVRVIAATSVDLDASIGAGRFRADLFYRLAVVEIALPALADRPGDIPLLIDHFAAQAHGGVQPRFTDAAMTYLSCQLWPGNVRELRNFVVRAAASRSGPIDDAAAAVLLHGERRAVDRWLSSDPQALPLPNRRRPPPIVPAGEVIDLKALLSDFERACLRDSLDRPAYDAGTAARRLGLARATPPHPMSCFASTHRADEPAM